MVLLIQYLDSSYHNLLREFDRISNMMFNLGFIYSLTLSKCSQVDPIVASFSGGAVGVVSALMVVEINNVKQQEHKRCKYCLGTGMKFGSCPIFGLLISSILFPLLCSIQCTSMLLYIGRRMESNFIYFKYEVSSLFHDMFLDFSPSLSSAPLNQTRYAYCLVM